MWKYELFIICARLAIGFMFLICKIWRENQIQLDFLQNKREQKGGKKECVFFIVVLNVKIWYVEKKNMRRN